MQTKNDFRFIIPYVEFAKEVKGRKPCILDTSVVIDGRIADVVETQVFDSQLVMPKFVISELQGIADSSDRLRRSRGRRGLDILNRLRTNPKIDLQIFDRDLPEFAGQPVDLKLVALAKHLQGQAGHQRLQPQQGRPTAGRRRHQPQRSGQRPEARCFLPGEQIEVRIVKVGEEPGQGVGYLEDGTMVVVESGRDQLNQTCRSPSPASCKPAPAEWCSGKSRSRNWERGGGSRAAVILSAAKYLGRRGASARSFSLRRDDEYSWP